MNEMAQSTPALMAVLGNGRTIKHGVPNQPADLMTSASVLSFRSGSQGRRAQGRQGSGREDE
jgi:hypothetical protein